MEPAAVPSLLEALRTVPDPRRARGTRSGLATALTFAVCGMLGGARRRYAIAQWGRDHNSAEVRAALGIGHADTPSVAPLFRVFRDVARDAFEAALAGWVRDVTFDEDRCQVRTGAAPQALAAIRNAVIGTLRRAGYANIAEGLRHHAARPAEILARLGLTPSVRL